MRNQTGLSDPQVARCEDAWAQLGGNDWCALDLRQARQHGSRTVYRQADHTVMLGADVWPGVALDARSRMSYLACLAHECGHAERHARGYDRTDQQPDMLIDEAEASLAASWNPVLSTTDRADLVEDAADRLREWLRCVAEDTNDGDCG